MCAVGWGAGVRGVGWGALGDGVGDGLGGGCAQGVKWAATVEGLGEVGDCEDPYGDAEEVEVVAR